MFFPLSKTDGGKGWADLWKRHYFGWEYKGKHKGTKAGMFDLKVVASEVVRRKPSLVRRANATFMQSLNAKET
jgi:hypothetical protein